MYIFNELTDLGYNPNIKYFSILIKILEEKKNGKLHFPFTPL